MSGSLNGSTVRGWTDIAQCTCHAHLTLHGRQHLTLCLEAVPRHQGSCPRGHRLVVQAKKKAVRGRFCLQDLVQPPAQSLAGLATLFVRSIHGQWLPAEQRLHRE